MSEIAIIGGGIGGLCTAIALRNHGFQPVVYEQTAELRPVGSGIWIPPNGMAALDQLGIADDIEHEGISLTGIEIESQDGHTLMSANLRATAAKLGVDRPMISIRRADLQRLLLTCLPDGVIQLEKECVAVDSSEPTVTFSDNTRIEPSLVIGADGVRSAVRSGLFPDVSVQYAGEIGRAHV